MSPAAEPAPGAAPAHLFAKAAPCDRLAVFSGDVLRAALHNALARCQLADVQLCCERGATRKLRRDQASRPQQPLRHACNVRAGASLEWRDEGEGQGMTALHIVVRARPGAWCFWAPGVSLHPPSLSPRPRQVATDAPAAKKLALLDWLVAQQARLRWAAWVWSELRRSLDLAGGSQHPRLRGLHAPALRRRAGRRGGSHPAAQGWRQPAGARRGGTHAAALGGACGVTASPALSRG